MTDQGNSASSSHRGQARSLFSARKVALMASGGSSRNDFREHDGNLSGFGPRWRAKTSSTYEQGNQGDV